MNRRPTQSRSDFDSFSPFQSRKRFDGEPGMDFFEPRRKRHPGRQVLLLLALLLVVVMGINTAVNRFVFVKRVSVPVARLPEAFDGYTILQISDLKGALFGEGQRRILSAVRGKRYDMVVLTGDMVSSLGNAEPLYALLDGLRELDPKAPIYYIAGDDDPEVASTAYASGGSAFAPWVLGARQRGAQLLSSPISITRGEHTLWLTTISALNLDLVAMEEQYQKQLISAVSSQSAIAAELASFNLGWLRETREARGRMSEEDVYICLAHVPPSAQELSASPSRLVSRIGLVLCGHYLGGLFRLPAAGALFVPSRSLPRYGILPGPSAFSSLERVGGARVYTSTGLGTDDALYPRMLFRFCNPPSVSLLTLTPSSL